VIAVRHTVAQPAALVPTVHHHLHHMLLCSITNTHTQPLSLSPSLLHLSHTHTFHSSYSFHTLNTQPLSHLQFVSHFLLTGNFISLPFHFPTQTPQNIYSTHTETQRHTHTHTHTHTRMHTTF